MKLFTSLSKREQLLITFAVVAILSRLIPHVPNFTAVTATALFAGRFFERKALAYALPLAVMVISDVILGFYTISLFVYASFAAVVLIGQLSGRMNVVSVLVSSLVFFVLSNFGVWVLAYPKTIEGFVACYTAALPFLRASVLGDLFYAAVLYYGFVFAERRLLLRA